MLLGNESLTTRRSGDRLFGLPAGGARLGGACKDVQRTIDRYVAEHNHTPRPFIWTADADSGIAKFAR